MQQVRLRGHAACFGANLDCAVRAVPCSMCVGLETLQRELAAARAAAQPLAGSLVAAGDSEEEEEEEEEEEGDHEAEASRGRELLSRMDRFVGNMQGEPVVKAFETFAHPEVGAIHSISPSLPPPPPTPPTPTPTHQ